MEQTSSSASRRIKMGELQVGTPLQFDVFDAEHRLLLRRGNRICSEAQLERLLRQGIFFGPAHGGADAERAGEPPRTPVVSPDTCAAPEVSAFLMLDDCARGLDALLGAGSPEPGDTGFADRIGVLAARIQRLCRSDSDAALAYVLLGQAPHYAIRQHLNVAILVTLMLSRLPADSIRAHSALAAALTMNVGALDLHEEMYWAEQADSQQRAALREHPIGSARVLRGLGVTDAAWLHIVEQHHEALDGCGYPRGLGGGQVCKEARLIAIADRYNGMVMKRAHRRGMPPDLALKELSRRDGAATDPSLLGLLIRVIGVYPPGTVVALANREVGVVTNRLLDLKHPIVRAFFIDPYWPYGKPVKRFTGRMPQFQIARALSRDDLNFTIDPEQLWPPVSLLGPAGARPPPQEPQRSAVTYAENACGGNCEKPGVRAMFQK